MKERCKLTLLRGTAIIMLFSIVAFSSISLAIQGESDLIGRNEKMRAISVTRVGDLELQVHVLGSVHNFRISPVLSETYKRCRNAMGDLAFGMATSLRRSMENLMGFR